MFFKEINKNLKKNKSLFKLVLNLELARLPEASGRIQLVIAELQCHEPEIVNILK